MPSDLKQLTDQQRQSFADLRSATVVRPIGRGVYLVQLPSGEQVTAIVAAGNITYAPNTTVTVGTYAGDRSRVILGLPPSTGMGSAVFGGGESASSDVTLVKAIAVDPLTVIPGVTDQVVYMIGIGFVETPVTTFRAVVSVAGVWEVDPLVDIHTESWIADPVAEGLTVAPGMLVIKTLVDVDAAAAVGYEINPQAEGPSV